MQIRNTSSLIDLIHIQDLRAFCRLGVYDFEREGNGQELVIDLCLAINLTQATKSDQLADTVDYVDISKLVQEIARAKEYFLIEHLAGEICSNILDRFTRIENVNVRVHKPIIQAEGFSGKVSIELSRKRV